MKTKTIGILLTMLAVIFSCSTDIDETIYVSENNENSCIMHLNGSVIPFDYSTGSRATTSYSWNNGDKLYIMFTTATGGTTNGTATYNSTTRTWDVTYTSSLVRDKSTSCKVYFFDGNYNTIASTIKLSESNGVYSDTNASYSFPQNGDLTITASLKPATSRIRFKGTVGENLSINGIKFYNEYSIGTSTLITIKNTTITSTVGSNGYTPYIYGTFDNTSISLLTVSYKSYTFSANCTGQSMLVVGKSGWMSVPTEYSHNGWTLTRANGTFNGHEYVDLGLTSGNLWATCNVGANKPEELGNTYKWGEVEPSNSLPGDYYKHGIGEGVSYEFTKYCNDSNKGYKGYVDNKHTLDLTDDAAYVNWGSYWRIPSVEDVDELIDECNYSNITRNGISGKLFVSKSNQNSIFFPFNNDIKYYSTNSLYLIDCTDAYALELSSWSPWGGIRFRCYEQYVRPIVRK